jgi:hypothetical protein
MSRPRSGAVAPEPPAPGLVNRIQAAEILGVSPASVKRYTLEGRLRRVDGGGRCVTAWYRAADVEALRPGTRTALREQAEAWKLQIVESGQRECRACRRTLPLSDFHSSGRRGLGPGGRAARCKECLSGERRGKRQADPEHYRAQWRRWARKNRVYLAARSRRYQQEHKPLVQARFRRWCAKNAARIAVYKADMYRRRRAIDDGKRSPLCRKAGFSLVRCAGGKDWRAARLDRPIERGEAALARFERLLGRWVVTAPPVASAEALRVTAWCQAREKRLREKRRVVVDVPTPVAGRRM